MAALVAAIDAPKNPLATPGVCGNWCSTRGSSRSTSTTRASRQFLKSPDCVLLVTRRATPRCSTSPVGYYGPTRPAPVSECGGLDSARCLPHPGAGFETILTGYQSADCVKRLTPMSRSTSAGFRGRGCWRPARGGELPWKSRKDWSRSSQPTPRVRSSRVGEDRRNALRNDERVAGARVTFSFKRFPQQALAILMRSVAGTSRRRGALAGRRLSLRKRHDLATAPSGHSDSASGGGSRQ